MANTHKLLMIPGPSEAYPEVTSELAKPVLPHYGEEWGEIHKDTCNKLKKIFNTNQSVILLPGPGVAGMELTVGNLVGPGEKAIIALNGWFSEMFRRLVEIYGATPLVERVDYGKVVPAERIRKRLKQEGDVKAIFVVQNDTATGVLHPIEEIGVLAREYGALFAVDSVSIFGGGEIRADEWGIDICIGYPSKALGAVNGIVPIMVSERAWKAVEERKQPMRSHFFNLRVWKKFIEEWGPWGHPHPSSMPCSLVVGLKKAVEIALEEGLDSRYRRHRVAGEAVRAGIRALGLSILADEEVASPTVTVVTFPQDINPDSIRNILVSDHNIMVAGSEALIGKKGIRIGHMGVTASPLYVLPTLAALEGALLKEGVKVKPGSGIAAATEAFQSRLLEESRFKRGN